MLLGSQIAGRKHRETPSSTQLDKGGGHLQLTISAEANSFDIFVNKEKYYSYQYREDVRKVKRIKYAGDGATAAMSVGRVGTSDCTQYIILSLVILHITCTYRLC